jgi:hypothetical protein
MPTLRSGLVTTATRFPPLSDLPDEVIASVFSFLPLASLLTASTVGRLWHTVASTWVHSIEGSMCDVDPFASLGPAGAFAALRPPPPQRGLSSLALLARLGAPACTSCGGGVGALWHAAELRRVCGECGEGVEGLAPCWNRFLFAPRSAGVRVASEGELRAALEALDPEFDFSLGARVIVVTADIELGAHLELYDSIRLCGETEGITLSCATGPAVMTAAPFVLIDNLSLVSGEADYAEEYQEGNHWPTIEAFHVGWGTAHLLLRGCSVHGNVGSAVMNDGNSVVMEKCEISSNHFYGFINKTRADTFFAAAYACRFGGSMWHISAGSEIIEGERAALVAANFDDDVHPWTTAADLVSRSESYKKGVVQPWRSGWIQRRA